MWGRLESLPLDCRLESLHHRLHTDSNTGKIGVGQRLRRMAMNNHPGWETDSVSKTESVWISRMSISCLRPNGNAK